MWVLLHIIWYKQRSIQRKTLVYLNMKKEEFIFELKACYEMVVEMINLAEQSNMLNYQSYYTLKDGLLALIESMNTNGFIEQSVYGNWDKKIIWWISRVLEGDPLLDRILLIDKEISSFY